MINKKLIGFFVYVILSVWFSSCGSERPIFNGKIPFIVTEISEYDETHALYYGRFNTGMGENGNGRLSLFSAGPCIVLPKGYYNIGDTILFPKPSR